MTMSPEDRLARANALIEYVLAETVQEDGAGGLGVLTGLPHGLAVEIAQAAALVVIATHAHEEATGRRV